MLVFVCLFICVHVRALAECRFLELVFLRYLNWKCQYMHLTYRRILFPGARRGLLLRGGDVLERLASVNKIIFDKVM